jgi:hypothetical protein
MPDFQFPDHIVIGRVGEGDIHICTANEAMEVKWLEKPRSYIPTSIVKDAVRAERREVMQIARVFIPENERAAFRVALDLRDMEEGEREALSAAHAIWQACAPDGTDPAEVTMAAFLLNLSNSEREKWLRAARGAETARATQFVTPEPEAPAGV